MAERVSQRRAGMRVVRTEDGGQAGVLVLRPGALGDTLLAVPALRALRAAYGSVTLGAHAGAARLLARVDEVDCGLAFDDPSLAWVFGGPPRRAPVVAWMQATGALGLEHALVRAPSRPVSGEQHVARYLLETLAGLGIDLAFDDRPLRVAQTPFSIGKGDQAQVSDVDDGAVEGTRPSVGPILVHPGSGSPGKNWPADMVAETIRRLDGPVALIVGEADVVAASNVEACLGRRLPRLEHLPLEVLAARLAGCRAYLGNDSGVSHLAGLCGAHAVVLFGPTSPEVWRPLGPRVEVQPFQASPRNIVARLLA